MIIYFKIFQVLNVYLHVVTAASVTQISWLVCVKSSQNNGGDIGAACLCVGLTDSALMFVCTYRFSCMYACS